MRVLVACEFSGIVTRAFLDRGHDAYSCDLLQTEDSLLLARGRHFRGDAYDWIDKRWDLLIAHPPCTYLARAGARWWKGKEREQEMALEFVRVLAEADVLRIAIENPIGCLSTRWRKPDQIVHPWQFGHGETKATCLWLKGLPPLVPTCVVEGRRPAVHKAPDSKDRWKRRSRTYLGIAEAMATQWGAT